MKIRALYLSLIAAALTGLAACDNAEHQYDDVTGEGRLFLNEALGTDKSDSFVIPDDGRTYTVTPRISKPLDRDLTLTLYVDEQVLADYNSQYNTSYELLPASNYHFETTAVIPAGKVLSKPVTIKLDPLTTEQNKTGFVHALPIAVKAADESMPVLDGSDAFLIAASPVPYSNVVEVTGNCVLQARFAEDYKLSSWTFETLFNASEIYNSNRTSWLACAVGFYEQGGTHIIQDGFMLRLGDTGGGTKNSFINGMVSRSGKQISSIPLKSNYWHHIAIVCDEGAITLYIDGNAGYTAKSGYKATQFFALDGIRFGGECGNNTSLGSLRYRYCQARFWSVARSVTELNNNRYAVPVDTPGLLGYWKFNEYTEGTAKVTENGSAKCTFEDTPLKDQQTWLFKDATGQQPDAFIHYGGASNPAIFTPDKRIEVGYTWEGVPAQ